MTGSGECALLHGCRQRWRPDAGRRGQGGEGDGAMAAGGAGCGDTVEECRVEVERLTRELAEANREKVRAAECGLVVLEENQRLKQQYADLEAEQEALRLELEQLQEVGSGDHNLPSTISIHDGAAAAILDLQTIKQKDSGEEVVSLTC
ncbi:unnamed protein product [Pleuronectes platessa]|uniref:Uncharacterized protein n=1 Tax=Pleuronectes platessa TaxID=8262 RepID=A0A9N7Y595_PLEPL|nr:unnamed protein product [Pleuronectes platessa]